MQGPTCPGGISAAQMEHRKWINWMMTAVLEHPWQSDAVAESSVGPADEENLSSKASSSVCSCNFGLVVLGFFFLFTHRGFFYYLEN